MRLSDHLAGRDNWQGQYGRCRGDRHEGCAAAERCDGQSGEGGKDDLGGRDRGEGVGGSEVEADYPLRYSWHFDRGLCIEA